jgi:hypothetical protein
MSLSYNSSGRREMSVAAYRRAGLIDPEGLSLLQHACENFKSRKNMFYIQSNHIYGWFGR